MARPLQRVNRHAIVTAVYYATDRLEETLGSLPNAKGMAMRASFLAALIMVTLAPSATANPAQWRLEGWKTNFEKTEVKLREIISGGPPRDGIPPIDDPVFAPPGDANYAGREPVIALTVNGDSRAYPLSVLIWHEIVNDTVGGVPVAVTFCPLCDAAIVFDRRVDGRTLRFGTTGKLRHSDLVMWDDATESWWQQFSGRAIVGDYAGTELTMLPGRVESWDRFQERCPMGKVLVPSNPAMRRYGENPYVGYDEAPWPFLYRGEVPEGVFAMDRVVKVGDRAWSLRLLQERGQIRAAGGLMLRWEPGQATALGERTIAGGADIGNVVVQRHGEDVVHDVTFLFAFHAFLPEGMIYIACEPGQAIPKPPLMCF